MRPLFLIASRAFSINAVHTWFSSLPYAEMLGSDAGLGKFRCDLSCICNLAVLQPGNQRFFADRNLCRRQGRSAIQAAAHMLVPFAQCFHVLRLETKTAQSEALAAEDLQL